MCTLLISYGFLTGKTIDRIFLTLPQPLRKEVKKGQQKRS